MTAEVIYGRNPVKEALRGRRAVRKVWATASLAGQDWLESAAVEVERAERATLDEITKTQEHQGVAAEVEPFPYVDAAALLGTERATNPLIVALDSVQDPHNLGAVARVAECAGATGIVIPERRAATVTAAACSASAGALEHIAVARVVNLANFLLAAKEGGFWVYGAAAGGSQSYLEADYRVPLVVVLGSEGKGLRPRVQSCCDLTLSIPVAGRVESLNVSTAAAALLFEIVRQKLA